jgi:hypothetical protein
MDLLGKKDERFEVFLAGDFADFQAHGLSFSNEMPLLSSFRGKKSKTDRSPRGQ